jgi:hypothetical protein
MESAHSIELLMDGNPGRCKGNARKQERHRIDAPRRPLTVHKEISVGGERP